MTVKIHTRLWQNWALGFMGLLLALPLAGADISSFKSTSDQPPRKVIVGTVMQPFWVQYPGLQKRLEQLTAIVDRMQAESEKKYGRGLDLAVLPEVALTGEGGGGDVLKSSFPLEGPVKDTFSQQARKYHCYIVVPTYLLEDPATKLNSNAAILFDRKGDVAGIYRKVHLVTNTRTGHFEHSATPGKTVPVFDCDFGKLGIQICYDMEFDTGWKELARQDAELVVWPTQSPQTSQPASRAKIYHCFIVSSTWRNNASVFEPTGKIVSQIKWPEKMNNVVDNHLNPPADNILVQELDLSYAILPWSRTLKNGLGLKEAFGDKVGYRYYEDEDCGMFWSNDPHMTIRQMLQSKGLMEQGDEYRKVEEIYHKDGVVGY
jgi:predicted amidohydrolase